MNTNNPGNNLSDRDYGTDGRLWACANNLVSVRVGVDVTLQTQPSEKAEALLHILREHFNIYSPQIVQL